jgi:hypothetical protein
MKLKKNFITSEYSNVIIINKVEINSIHLLPLNIR